MKHLIFITCAMFALPCQAADPYAADAVLNIHVGIISYQDVVRICAEDNPPSWCPEHLREPVQEVEFSEEQAEWLSEIEPASDNGVLE